MNEDDTEATEDREPSEEGPPPSQLGGHLGAVNA
jgi:hypothetical protein